MCVKPDFSCFKRAYSMFIMKYLHVFILKSFNSVFTLPSPFSVEQQFESAIDKVVIDTTFDIVIVNPSYSSI